MTLSAGTRLGPYEILAPLGAGGMGEVYRARIRLELPAGARRGCRPAPRVQASHTLSTGRASFGARQSERRAGGASTRVAAEGWGGRQPDRRRRSRDRCRRSGRAAAPYHHPTAHRAVDEVLKTHASNPDWVECESSRSSTSTLPSHPTPRWSRWTDHRLCTSSFVGRVP